MYSYYAALFWRPQWRRWGNYVTVLQLSQFVAAVYFTWVYSTHFSKGALTLTWCMYGYYLAEFTRLLLNRH